MANFYTEPLSKSVIAVSQATQYNSRIHPATSNSRVGDRVNKNKIEY
jgi:hypothetical protein